LRIADSQVRTLCWLQGNAIGQLTAEGDNKARRSAAFYARRLISLQKPLGVRLGQAVREDLFQPTLSAWCARRRAR